MLMLVLVVVLAMVVFLVVVVVVVVVFAPLAGTAKCAATRAGRAHVASSTVGKTLA